MLRRALGLGEPFPVGGITDPLVAPQWGRTPQEAAVSFSLLASLGAFSVYGQQLDRNKFCNLLFVHF